MQCLKKYVKKFSSPFESMLYSSWYPKILRMVQVISNFHCTSSFLYQSLKVLVLYLNCSAVLHEGKLSKQRWNFVFEEYIEISKIYPSWEIIIVMDDELPLLFDWMFHTWCRTIRSLEGNSKVWSHMWHWYSQSSPREMYLFLIVLFCKHS